MPEHEHPMLTKAHGGPCVEKVKPVGKSVVSQMLGAWHSQAHTTLAASTDLASDLNTPDTTDGKLPWSQQSAGPHRSPELIAK